MPIEFAYNCGYELRFATVTPLRNITGAAAAVTAGDWRARASDEQASAASSQGCVIARYGSADGTHNAILLSAAPEREELYA